MVTDYLITEKCCPDPVRPHYKEAVPLQVNNGLTVRCVLLFDTWEAATDKRDGRNNSSAPIYIYNWLYGRFIVQIEFTTHSIIPLYLKIIKRNNAGPLLHFSPPYFRSIEDDKKEYDSFKSHSYCPPLPGLPNCGVVAWWMRRIHATVRFNVVIGPFCTYRLRY